MDDGQLGRSAKMNISVELGCAFDGTLVVEIIDAFVSHILHMRGQIPLPIPLLEQYPRSVQEAGKITSTLKISRSEKKISEFMGRYTSILNQLLQLSQQTKILEVGIFFGPTPVNPREGYFLHFDYTYSREEVPEKIRLAACRKCIRSFLGYWAQDLPDSPPIMNTFLSIRLSNENSPLDPSFFPLDSEFILREHFSPQFRRKGASPAHLHIHSNPKSPKEGEMEIVSIASEISQAESPDQQIISAESSSSCLVLSKGLKGIKSLKV
jgi:hypothetical protein